MYNFVLQAHSGWRYLVLIALLVTIVKYLIGYFGGGKWSSFDALLNRITPILIDIQWLLGLVVWIVGSWWQNTNATLAWEHPVFGTLAVVIVHIFAARTKRAATSRSKYGTALLGYLIAGLLIAFGIYRAVGSWNLFGM